MGDDGHVESADRAEVEANRELICSARKRGRLALLGDPQATAIDDLKQALSTNHGVWAGTPAPDNRAGR